MTAQDARNVTNGFIQISNIDLFKEINQQCKLGKRSYKLKEFLPHEVCLCLKELGYEVWLWKSSPANAIETTFETNISW